MSRILFVDDDPQVLSGLRRMARRLGAQWTAEFAADGQAAHAMLQNCPVDVLVTDLRMPGMDGTALLGWVQEEHPDTVRIVLSGYANERDAAEVSGLAHRYLAKPCPWRELEAAIKQTVAARQHLGNPEVQALVAGVGKLPPMPDLYQRFAQMLRSNRAGSTEIATLLEEDMALSAKLLQLVNSAFFGNARRVSSVQRAVSLLGLNQLRHLVLSASVFSAFAVSDPVLKQWAERLWQRSVQVADLARRIAEAMGLKDDRPDQAYLAGLMHDMGYLVLMQRRPEAFLEFTAQPEFQSDLESEERRSFGAAHTEIGAYLLQMWNIPPRICEAVLFHHRPGACAYQGLNAVAAVHMAVALLDEHTSGPLNYRLLADVSYLHRLGLMDLMNEYREGFACAEDAPTGK